MTKATMLQRVRESRKLTGATIASTQSSLILGGLYTLAAVQPDVVSPDLLQTATFVIGPTIPGVWAAAVTGQAVTDNTIAKNGHEKSKVRRPTVPPPPPHRPSYTDFEITDPVEEGSEAIR